MRRYVIIGASALLFGLAALPAATLQRLSLDDMIQQSTAIVRGRIAGSFAQAQGPILYTHYQVTVAEQWKGAAAGSLDVVVPGGVAGGVRQTFSGAPKPEPGGDYVLFLWTSPKTGLTHIIGLSQGLLNVSKDATGDLIARRAPAGDVVVDAAGRVVRDEPFSIRLSDLRRRVSAGAPSVGGRK